MRRQPSTRRDRDRNHSRSKSHRNDGHEYNNDGYDTQEDELEHKIGGEENRHRQQQQQQQQQNHGEEEEEEEEEITRCVCGSQDYPGLPGIYRDLISRRELPGASEAVISTVLKSIAAAAAANSAGSHSRRRSTLVKSETRSPIASRFTRNQSHPETKHDRDTHAATTSTSTMTTGDRDGGQVVEEGEAEPPEPGSLFIQCDSCEVWQHGGCVGIMDEAASPDEYFCEKCRGDLHRIVIDGKGHRSSRYIPVVGDDAKAMSPPASPLPASRSSSRDKVASATGGPPLSARDRRSRNRESRELRNMQDVNAPPVHGSSVPPSKRRSTMNSRDAAYDEEELLRRAIEKSKEESVSIGRSRASTAAVEEEMGREKERENSDARALSTTAAGRRSKRGRIGEERGDVSAKRQRIGSPSPLTGPESRSGSSESGDVNRRSTAPIKGARAVSSRGSNESGSNGSASAENKGIEERDIGHGTGESGTTINGKRKRDATSEVDSLTPVMRSPVSPSIVGTDAGVDGKQENDDAAEGLTRSYSNGKKNGRPSSRRNGRGRNQYTRDRVRGKEPRASNVSGDTSLTNSGRETGDSTFNSGSGDVRSVDQAAVSPLPIRKRLGGEDDAGVGGDRDQDNAAGPRTRNDVTEQSLANSGTISSAKRAAVSDANQGAASYLHGHGRKEATSTKDAPASASRSKPSIGVNTSSAATIAATTITTVPTTHTHPSTHSHHPHHHHSSRTTLNEMRRRVAAILEFISRTQLDMAANGERITPPDVAKKVVPSNDTVDTAAQAVGLAAAAATSQGTSGEGEGEGKNEKESDGGTEVAKENAKDLAGERITIPEPEFEKLTSFDMMDVLTRGLLKWQQEFGKFGDR